MKYRRLDFNEDYSVLKDFFEHYWGEGLAPTPDRCSSDGIIAEDEEFGIVGGVFIYFTNNSQMAIIGFPVLNPKLSVGRASVMMSMIERAEFWARLLGYTYMNTWSGVKPVQKYLELSQYDKADECVNHYIKRL